MTDFIIDILGYSLGGFFVSFIISRIVNGFIGLVIFEKTKAATITFIISFIIIMMASSLMPIGFLNGLIVYIPFLLLLYFYDLYSAKKKICPQCNHKNPFYASVCNECGNELGGIRLHRGDSFLNIIQKIILLLGAIAIIYVVLATPRVYYFKGVKYIVKDTDNNNLAIQFDLENIMVYAGLIILVTIVLLILTHTKKKE